MLAPGGLHWLGQHACASADAAGCACAALAALCCLLVDLAARCDQLMLLCAPLAWAVLLAQRRPCPFGRHD
eukprot:8285487-Alexandrium_andersonii.AAC.1